MMQLANLAKRLWILPVLIAITAGLFRFAPRHDGSPMLSTVPAVVLLAVTIILTISISFRSTRHNRAIRALKQRSARGTAIIRGMNQIARTANTASAIELIADVSIEHGHHYPVIINIPPARLAAAKYTIGSSIPVLINPEDAQDVMIDFRH
jgi:hypothetical protein